MRQLLLLRHAKSAWDEPGRPDHGRRLDARGRTDAASLAAALAVLAPPELVLVSTARRTRETLDAVGAWIGGAAVEPRDALYLASADELLEQVRGLPERAGRVLLIGHNPGLHELAVALAGGAERERLRAGFPTGAFAEFGSGTAWPEFGRAPARLVRFLRPRDLQPELA